jgi:protein arginine kinase activator
MQCDDCGSSDAVIHVTQVESNEMNTFHLCEACATAKGLETGTVPASPLTDFLAQMGTGMETGPAAVTDERCGTCGLTLSDFRKAGRLGCADCYTHFARHLRGLLRRLHGGSQHVGKVYLAEENGHAERAARMVNLRRSLQQAVESEDFERAATLRDQIRQMDEA